MFSSRLEWGHEANSLAQLLERKRAAGEPLLDLTESNPTAAGFDYPEREIVASLADPRSLRYEPNPAGLLAARDAVAEYYRGRVNPQRLLLTASTSEAYALVFKLLADPGDDVLVPRPSYPLFEFLASLESVRVKQYALVYHGRWEIDLDALASAITERTRAIVLVNPNNPTGSFLKIDELQRLIALCKEHQLALVSDEVFGDYALREASDVVRSLIDVDEVLTFVFSGLSKVVGLPQLKLGWIAAGGPPELRLEALRRMELIADTYLSVATPVQWALPILLSSRRFLQEQIRARTRRNLEFLREQIGPSSSWRVLDVEGGWYAIVQAPRIRSEEEWALLLLREDGVLVQPGFFFDMESEAFLVVSLLTRPDTFSEGIRRILARV